MAADNLFDFIRILFRPEEYARATRADKHRYFFMVNRFMSINFPLQAQAFNHTKVSQAEAMDYWHAQLSKLYSKPPDWLYTKTGKKTTIEKTKRPSDEAVSVYLQKTGMTRRDLEDAIRLFGDGVLDPIRKFEKSMTA